MVVAVLVVLAKLILKIKHTQNFHSISQSVSKLSNRENWTKTVQNRSCTEASRGGLVGLLGVVGVVQNPPTVYIPSRLS